MTQISENFFIKMLLFLKTTILLKETLFVKIVFSHFFYLPRAECISIDIQNNMEVYFPFINAII